MASSEEARRVEGAFNRYVEWLRGREVEAEVSGEAVASILDELGESFCDGCPIEGDVCDRWGKRAGRLPCSEWNERLRCKVRLKVVG